MVVLAVFGLAALFILIVYKNKMASHFRLDEKGAYFFTREEDRKKNTAVNLAVFIMGVISNKPGAVSTGIAGQLTQDCSIKWKNVDRFKVYDSSKAIYLRAGFGNKITVGGEKIWLIMNLSFVKIAAKK